MQEQSIYPKGTDVYVNLQECDKCFNVRDKQSFFIDLKGQTPSFVVLFSTGLTCKDELIYSLTDSYSEASFCASLLNTSCESLFTFFIDKNTDQLIISPKSEFPVPIYSLKILFLTTYINYLKNHLVFDRLPINPDPTVLNYSSGYKEVQPMGLQVCKVITKDFIPLKKTKYNVVIEEANLFGKVGLSTFDSSNPFILIEGKQIDLESLSQIEVLSKEGIPDVRFFMSYYEDIAGVTLSDKHVSPDFMPVPKLEGNVYET